jgi:hypothetical protein
VSLSDALAKALKATALVALLLLGWYGPANAHAGHRATPKGIGPSAITSPQKVQEAFVFAASPVEAAPVCPTAQSGLSDPLGSQPQEGVPGRSCCGTLCTVALIDHGIAPLPLRIPHPIRLALPPDTPALTRTPGLSARPPRTNDIA